MFITDNELGQDEARRLGDFARFAQDCDLLIHDSQYLPQEMPEHRGWGHSTYEEAVHLAVEAGAKRRCSLLTTTPAARTRK